MSFAELLNMDVQYFNRRKRLVPSHSIVTVVSSIDKSCSSARRDVRQTSPQLSSAALSHMNETHVRQQSMT
jgi:hypothetical protein